MQHGGPDHACNMSVSVVDLISVHVPKDAHAFQHHVKAVFFTIVYGRLPHHLQSMVMMSIICFNLVWLQQWRKMAAAVYHTFDSSHKEFKVEL